MADSIRELKKKKKKAAKALRKAQKAAREGKAEVLSNKDTIQALESGIATVVEEPSTVLDAFNSLLKRDKVAISLTEIGRTFLSVRNAFMLAEREHPYQKGRWILNYLFNPLVGISSVIERIRR